MNDTSTKNIFGVLAVIALIAVVVLMNQMGANEPNGGSGEDSEIPPKLKKEVLLIENPGLLEFVKYHRKYTKVIVYFGATWCEPCKAAKPEWRELMVSLRSEFAFVNIDVDDVPIVQRREKVRDLPTWIVYHNGKEVGRQIGFPGNLNLVREYAKSIGK